MDSNPKEFYSSQVLTYQTQLKKIKSRLLAIGMLRLGVFLLTGVLVYFLRSQANWAVISGVIGLVLFLGMISKHTDLRLEKKRLEQLIALNERELRILNRDISGLESGEEWIGESHYYNQDIDLFGKGTIFQYINRAETHDGKARLAEILNSNDPSHIVEKQELVKELATMSVWRQDYQTTAALIESDVENRTIINWLVDYKPTIPAIFAHLPWIVTLFSTLLFVLYGLGIIPGAIVLVWFFVGLITTMPFLGKVSKLYLSASKVTETFSQYAKLLSKIENQTFKADFLIREQEKIKADNRKASSIFQSLSKELNSLDQRNNIFFAIAANGFLLWDLRYAFRIEKWIKNYRDATSNWFEVIAEFDALNSLGNYAFNNPEDTYPVVTTNPNIFIKAKQLGHQLLKPEQRVSNDLEIGTTDFMIITGANMAGKSTFLRTVALNLVLANTGLPVCAVSFEYQPTKLITSMRTSDSLLNDESYFFSELKRLKYIVDELKTQRYFIILDEILKGTNSKDKEEGSKKFVQKLVGTGSTGIIATHDLSLCQLSETLPQIKNHYFDAEIVNDELYFDYRFKDGVCQNMNASFLLRKMEIV